MTKKEMDIVHGLEITAADPFKLAELIRKKRGVQKDSLTIRESARQAKVSHSAIWRAENCRPITLENWRRITAWLMKSANTQPTAHRGKA